MLTQVSSICHQIATKHDNNHPIKPSSVSKFDIRHLPFSTKSLFNAIKKAL